MRKWWFAAVLPLLAAAAVAQEQKVAFEKRSYPFEGEVAAERLNVRMFPKNDQTGIITSVLSLGEKVTVVAETGDYYQILPPKGSTAWVVSRNVKREGEAGTVLGTDIPVRLDSRVNADQVATLKQGEAVRIVGENMGWFKIESPAAVKYFVGKKYVRPGKELDPGVVAAVAPRKDEGKGPSTASKSDADAKARALIAMAEDELKVQEKLLDERRMTDFNLAQAVALYESAKTESASPAVRAEAERGLQHVGTVHKLWEKTKAGIVAEEEKIRAAQLAATVKPAEPAKPVMAGHIDTTGLLWKRPGTHKLVMGGKTVCFVRVKEGDEKMISRLNDFYGRYVGINGTVIKNPEGWDGYSVVVVEEIIPLTSPQ
jgi:uncharacterized protein YgiM (DUF1202 family)